ncbi:helix-turn-helix transcriptional regulator [Catenuloplanes japonicus]|uniref:helix-turn-helix transcriptional regulator n=1 Tax=Catenuloplanes japonicus TaxID=33876 RepID=UPI0005243CB5|nr:LuxR C-terminal-related transcriptional regulator [Catenuloplanes japonicus]
MEQIAVVLRATDALTGEGLDGLLSGRPGIVIRREVAGAAVVVVAIRRLTTRALGLLRRFRAESGVPIVLVGDEIGESELLAAIGCGVVAIIPRRAVTAERLAHSVTVAASGGGVMPPHLVGGLLKHIERLQSDVLAWNDANPSRLSARETEVLRLLADGLDTVTIAGRLRYSERTVKNVIHGFTRRLQLRNRSHAVAYAVRAGLI